MARGKKAAQGLTPEEKLAQVLVPVEEQPYQIPENWCWTYIKFLFDVTSSKRVHKEDWTNTGIPFYRTRELVKLSEQGYVDNELFITEDLYDKIIADYGKPTAGDVLISGVGTIGVPYVVENSTPFYFKDGNVIWFQNRKKCNAKYIYYLYKSLFMYNQIHGMSSGTTVDTYTIVNANGTMLPLPPLTEQQRIVDRIESIFAKLDEAKEKAQAVVDGFELRKSSILHKAFTGELTAKWREEHKIEIDDWKNYKIDECCKVGSGGTPSRKHPEYYEGSIPWIKTGEIDWNNILDAEEKISDAAVQDSSAKIYEPGVVLVAMYGMGVTRGKAAILRVQAATNQAVCVLQPKNDLLNRYLFYYFMYNYWNIREKSVGGNQLNLSATIIKNFDILIPSIDEQSEIIRILDGLLAKEKAAKEAAASILDQIDTMKKAVLARAFRGELGTNNPAEESAVELLKKML